MRITSSVLKIISITAASAALFGCGNGNSNGSAALLSGNGRHVADWVQLHSAAAASSMESCTECHGSDLSGGISKVSCMSPTAISGYRCHATSPADNPAGCVSCHGGLPSGPFGDTAPNRKLAHDKHTALTACGTCHLNAGTGTVGHARATAAGGFNRATVTLSGAFTAETFTTFGYDAPSDTCSGVSCHGSGGKLQAALPWSTGAITMATACYQCHEQGTAPTALGGPPTPQYNSFYSGLFSGAIPATNLHEFHLRQTTLNASGTPVFCTDCHNIGTLTDQQKHFGRLTSNTFSAPGTTVGGVPTGIGSYDTTTQACSNVACHTAVPKNNVRWVQ